MFGFFFGTACLAGLIYTLRARRHWHHLGGRWGRARLRWLFERLETSPGQEKVILKTADEVMEAFSKLRDEMDPSRAALGRAMRGEQFDGAALRELFARHDVALDNVRRTLQGGLAQVHEALNPRQRRELADLLEQSFGHGWRPGYGYSHGWHPSYGYGFGHGHGRCGGRGGWHRDAPPMV
ncbi:periplasmic heavy metal sensor [Pyxidicoccus fallax]|uniref:Periplasmic heavy metal sensor n=1 Tax=Pyxidicoccus fallax TaxID=394095 RepID=A0A848LR36_9BACT|nr:periplasmic heavy metal sensor [Pyxidicoccus fallax]NMO20365.1 periplasmic heavy metal sensor [Pyxidicoccus fallax]NPC83765.1 periplasmic heavy metal sensor [Pyxidicoccus fallax]